MIVDANLLIYATDEASPWHDRAREWLEETLNGPRQTGLPWPSLLAFVRIVTHPRVTAQPLSGEAAWELVAGWLALDTVWTPTPTARHAVLLGSLIRDLRLSGNLVPDAHLAALALEHGIGIFSTDTDFARFPELLWVNPLAA